MRFVLHSLSSFVIFDMPDSTPHAGGADPCTTTKMKGMIRSAAAGTHSRHSRIADLDVKAAICNVLGCISPPFVKNFVRFLCVRVGFGISFSRDSW